MNQRCLEETWTRLESALGHEKKRSLSHRISKRAINSTKRPSSRSNSTSFKVPKETISTKQLKKIYKAKCEDMRIPVLPDQESRFITFCINNFKNRHFHMKEAGLASKSAFAIGRVLKTASFAYVDLSKNSLAGDGAYILLKEINESQTIAHLDLSNNEIPPEGFEKIAMILACHPSIVSIDFSSYEGLHRNRLSNTGAMHLSTALKRNVLLQFIGLAGTGLNEGIEHIAFGITGTCNLVSLDLSNNGLIGKQMECLSKAVVKTQLKMLNLSYNKIADDGCEFLSNMILGAYEAACPVVNLNLSYNGITSKGAGKIFHSLRLNILIKDFNASGNQFSQGLSMYFNSFLSDNCVLTSLNLSCCGIKPDCLQSLSEGLIRNIKLETLILSHNKAEDAGAQHIAHGLSKNTGLKSIDLSSCMIKGQGALFLAKALRGNFTLQSLNLRDNSVKDDSGEVFVEITRTNKNFLSINLDLNPVNLKFVESIKQNLRDNRRGHKKQQIPKIKQEIEKMRIPIDTYESLNAKIRTRLQEKTDFERKHEINDETYEEFKASEEQKTQKMISEHHILREKNVDLSRNLDASQSEMIKLRVQNERKIEELHFKIRLADIENAQSGKILAAVKENYYKKKEYVDMSLMKYRERYNEEEGFCENAKENLKNLRFLLEDQKRQVESLKVLKGDVIVKSRKGSQIPSEFLATEKLAMNKKKYSPKKKVKTLSRNQRSSSAIK